MFVEDLTQKRVIMHMQGNFETPVNSCQNDDSTFFHSRFFVLDFYLIFFIRDLPCEILFSRWYFAYKNIWQSLTWNQGRAWSEGLEHYFLEVLDNPIILSHLHSARLRQIVRILGLKRYTSCIVYLQSWRQFYFIFYVPSLISWPTAKLILRHKCITGRYFNLALIVMTYFD